MPEQIKTPEQIDEEIDANRATLEEIKAARNEAKWYLSYPSPIYDMRIQEKAAPEGHRRFRLMAQGDSWFDYPPGNDIVDCLHNFHGHVFRGPQGDVTNLAVAGSTLNDEAYGPVPWGQSGDISRIAELVHRIREDRPDALLLSGGGNDVAGPEFFSFINNADSGLPEINQDVVNGVINQTFRKAFEYLIDFAIAAAGHRKMPIFIHGYDYPWPDGRGVIDFILWKIGPWFHESFNHKNYFYKDANDLWRRHNIVKNFIDPLNALIIELETKYKGRVFYDKLTETLRLRNEWANELHPRNPGFALLAAKINDALQIHVP
jgi:lysophospholipase L1-like esterase